MAIQLYVSNSLKGLADHFCNELIAQPKQVFIPTSIITQTDGMNSWLKYRVANQLGISANFEYVKSQDIINKVYFLLGGRITNTLSTQNLSWIIFKLLNENTFSKSYPNIAAYFTTTVADKDVKRMALAEKVADLFDQYQIYREDIIEKWNKNTQLNKVEDWQQYLWIKLKLLVGNQLPDKTQISNFITAQLQTKEQQLKLQARLPSLYLFGLSITTSYHLRLYHCMAQFIPVKFYLINPAPTQYWFDDKNEKLLAYIRKKQGSTEVTPALGNPLLTSWGKVLQDTYKLLFEDEGILNAYQEVGISLPKSNTLLEKIQTNLFYNDSEILQFDEDDCKDGSLIINACYSPAREVEVLYNYLVQTVLKNPAQLSARDIVVMVTDIYTYAPFIKAIFDNAPHKFKYAIADQTYIESNSISSALKLLLAIDEEVFTTENVLQILESTFIRQRFGIHDVGLIREALNQSNIRFGTNNNVDNDTVFVSWQYGLKRIMYGICMSGQSEYGEGAESLYPLDIVEGSASEQLVRFNHFVQVLIATMQQKQQARNITEWIAYMQTMLSNFIIEPDLTNNEEYQIINKQVEAYHTLHQYFDEQINFRVFEHSILQILSTTTTAGTFTTVGITFCSLIPMRSIPFAVVALLGINFDKFPRKENPISFNLMEKEKRKGDRNVKENDKHLFLETLVSAQQYLYISYVGQSAKDNSSMPASALVDELIDYIQTHSSSIFSVKDILVKKHPLHGFSRKYNGQDDRLITYLNTAKVAVEKIILTQKIIEPITFTEIMLDNMTRFFKNPIKAYYHTVLKIYYNADDTLLEETELFELNQLQTWALKYQLLWVEKQDVLSLKDGLIKTGQLPLKNMGELVLTDTDAEINDVRAIFKNIIGQQKAETLPIEIELDGTMLKGTISDLYGSQLVVVSFSTNEIKNIVEAYIKYLAICATGTYCTLHYISAKKMEVFTASVINKQEAIARLTELVALYQYGHKRILLFYPSFNITPSKIDDLTEDSFYKMVNAVVNNYNYSSNDPYLIKEFENGLFNEVDALEFYKSSCKILMQPLPDFLPNFFNN